MASPKEHRLHWYVTKLRKKHPTYTEKAINQLAHTLLDLDAIGSDCDDDFLPCADEPNETDCKTETQTQTQSEFKQEEFNREQLARITQMGNNPANKGLFQNQKFAKKEKPKNIAVNKQDHLGRTPLHWAVYQGNLKEVKYLVLKKKADLTIKDNGQNTPYMIAVRDGHDQIAAFLLSL